MRLKQESAKKTKTNADQTKATTIDQFYTTLHLKAYSCILCFAQPFLRSQFNYGALTMF